MGTASQPVFLLCALALAFGANAQHHEPVSNNRSDSLVKYESAKHFFRSARWSLHSRTFFMSTVNEGQLKDDFALAQGTGIGMETPSLRGFHFGVSGYFIFNLWSSDIWHPDPLTGLPNRYEVGQFDVNNPRNRLDMDRLEELYLAYRHRGYSLTVGRMDLMTPFFNPQDGRMRPTLEEAIWLRTPQEKKLRLEGGYIHRVSPRSTLEWSRVGESVGIYGAGVDVNGQKSAYPGHVHSRGFGLAHMTWEPAKFLTLELWDGYFDNVSNTAMLELKSKLNLPDEKQSIRPSVMVIRQNTIGDGGNADPALAYAEKGSSATVISGRLGWHTPRNLLTINYTRITPEGRYLMPREWGRDPFYTFMNRERNEGFGDVHAAMISNTMDILPKRLALTTAYGYYRLPAVTDFRLNKYAMPSYHQVNLLANYAFDGFWKGLTVRTLVAAKFREKGMPDEPKYTYNKVNMVNFNLIVDFRI